MKILVCGIGNKIVGDDGFAQHLLSFLESEREIPDNVELGDYSTASLSMAKFLEDYDAVIFVDIIKKDGKPGTIYEFEIKKEDIPDTVDSTSNLFSFSIHEARLEELIIFAKSINALPDKIYLLGVEPKSIEPGLELSDELKPAVEIIADKVLELIDKLGS